MSSIEAEARTYDDVMAWNMHDTCNERSTMATRTLKRTVLLKQPGGRATNEPQL